MFTEVQTLLAPCSIFLGYLLFKLAYSETQGALGSFFKYAKMRILMSKYYPLNEFLWEAPCCRGGNYT